MPITVACDCGKNLRVKEEHAGRKVRCPGCRAAVLVPVPASEDAEEDAGDFLLNSEPEEKPDSTFRLAPPADQAETRVQNATSAPTPLPPPLTPKAGTNLQNLFEKKKRKKAERAQEWQGGGIAIHPEIIAGLGMMAGAAIWFYVGLAANRIYIYPPILFCLGIAAIIRGFTGKD